MALANPWLLPEGVKDILPPSATKIERVRRDLLDQFHGWGYNLVIPPMLEHLDALLTGSGQGLDLSTFKFTDCLSGQSLGVPADITPQVARIDAHRMRTQEINRLCYSGPVLHAQATHPLAGRNPLQIGAELFGDSDLEGDIEVINLMLVSLNKAGIKLENISLDLGHVGIFRNLVKAASLSQQEQAQYQDILQRKALPELANFVEQLQINADLKQALNALPRLYGTSDILLQAQQLFSAYPEILADVEYVQTLVQSLQARMPELTIYLDLSELRGYTYHTGVVFAAYAQDSRQALAKGGRYDDIGASFGASRRPATGFSADLNLLILHQAQAEYPEIIRAPAGECPDLLRKIAQLRSEGRVVVQALASEKEQDYSFSLVLEGSDWLVK